MLAVVPTPLALRLPGLAAQRGSAPGRAHRPRPVIALYEQLIAGRTDDFTLLEWLHVLRFKRQQDSAWPEHAAGTAATIWRAASREPALLHQLLVRLAEGACGGEGLAPSLIATWPQAAALIEPLAQEVIASLLTLDADPDRLVRLCIAQERTLVSLLQRVGLPDDLPLMNKLQARIPAVIQRLAQDPARRTEAAVWLLSTLREGSVYIQDTVVTGLLSTLQPAEAKALPDLCWWLGALYGPAVPNSRWRYLSAPSQERLKSWL